MPARRAHGEAFVVDEVPDPLAALYRVDRLRHRYGDHAAVPNAYLWLTQTCRYQREVESRLPNIYGIACRAKLGTTGTARIGGLPSRT